MSDPETQGEAQPATQAETQSPAEEARDFPMPPPTFEFLVLDIVYMARLHLGLLQLDPEKEPPPANLPAARHAIDLLGMLLAKTQGNLDLEEKRLLENSLTELRFRYVQAAEKAQPK